jgi:hypothetical protein
MLEEGQSFEAKMLMAAEQAPDGDVAELPTKQVPRTMCPPNTWRETQPKSQAIESMMRGRTHPAAGCRPRQPIDGHADGPAAGWQPAPQPIGPNRSSGNRRRLFPPSTAAYAQGLL